ncbi:hypothetical protein B0H66DRAFT_602816 [Apodospora peruviana]|uniref:Tetratricopeptide repeat protein 1 n=1 Tax=Apodospora peruviana TaxID=516989 RepID=A0AAE0I427_9PEZI|nr:hypothetical protein B0H66DRAFT_602816 [Apodospora peruviana]
MANPNLDPVGQGQQQHEEQDEQDAAFQPRLRFPPKEEATLLAESNAHKTEGNTLFSKGTYDAAINKYDEALAVCPNYLDMPLAILRTNMAICHLNLKEWKDAAENAGKAIENLDKLEREETEAENAKKPEAGERKQAREEDDVVEVEIVSAGAAKAGPAVPDLENEAEIARRKRQEDIARLRCKALLRRGRAKRELGTWRDLEDALKDYQTLSKMTNLDSANKRIVQAQLRELPPLVEAAKQEEIGQMWGKLKDLGNGLLKPFGLSTDQFNMVKDEKSGGYSLNFSGGGAKT